MEELLDKIIAVIREQNFPEIRSLLFGDPITYVDFDLPAIIVAPGTDVVSTYTTAKDQHLIRVAIYVVKSARDGFNSTVSESPVDRSLIRIADQIVATLREDVSLDGMVVTFQDVGVQYVPAVRNREAVRMAQMDARFMVLKSR